MWSKDGNVGKAEDLFFWHGMGWEQHTEQEGYLKKQLELFKGLPTQPNTDDVSPA